MADGNEQQPSAETFGRLFSMCHPVPPRDTVAGRGPLCTVCTQGIGGLILRRMHTITRRTVLGAIAAMAVATRARAQDFPDKPLRFVVGFPPGGPNDLLTRLIAPGIAERLGRPVVVENRAGANGEIAAASVAKAPADGSVFMLASNGSTTVAPALTPNMSFDVRRDFVAVAPVGINPMLLVVRPDLPAKNVEELLALARARPGKLNGASAGAGGATHLALELFKSLGKVDIVHVPYKGGGPAMADLMASMIDIYFGGLSTALPHVKAGKLRVLGQTGLDALAGRAGHSHDRRIGSAGLRGGDLLRHLPAGRRRARLGHEAARRGRRHDPLARHRAEVRRSWRRPAVRHTGGVRGLRCRGLCQMGQGRQGRRPEGRMTESLSIFDRRESRRLQELVHDVRDDRAVLLGLGALGDPFLVGLEGRPLLLAIGEQLPGEEIGEILVRTRPRQW